MARDDRPLFAGQLKIYKDKKCTEELKTDKDGNASLHMDVVNAGEKRKINLYIINRSKHDFEISEVTSEEEDVEFDFGSNILEKDKPVRMSVTFSPKRDRVTMLNSNFKIKGRFVINEY